MRRVAFCAMLGFALLTAACAKPLDPEAAIAKAQQAREKKDYGAAIVILKDLLQRNPNHAEARYVLGLAHNDAGDYRFGEQELRRARELDFDPAKVIPAHGRALLMSGAYKEVLDEVRLDANSVTNRGQAEILSMRAHALIGLGRFGEAESLLDQALAKQPEFEAALLGKSKLAVGNSQIDEAKRLIDRAIASAPQSIDAWIMKGDLARLTADAKAAAAAYEHALKIDPNNVIGIANSARMAIAEQRFDAARKHIADLRKRAPELPLTNFLEALSAYQRKDYPTARSSLQQVLKVAPNNIEALLLSGLVEMTLGSHDHAQAHLAQALKYAPGSLYGQRLLIVSLARSGRLEKARDLLERSLQRAPEDRHLMQIAGELYLQYGEFSKAVVYLEKTAKADPNNVQARAALGISRFSLGDTERALAEVGAAAKLDTEGYSVDVLAVVLNMRRHNYDEALKAGKNLENKQPKNPLTHTLVGLIHAEKHDLTSARARFEHALELDPTYVPAATELARLDLRDNQPKAARARLQRVLDKDENNISALTALVSLAPAVGATPKDQIAWLERANKASPNTTRLELMLAVAYGRNGDFPKALEIVRRAHAVHPDRVDVLETLGALQFSAGEKEQALSTYERMVALQPRSASAFHKLASVRAAQGDLEGALDSLRKSVTLDPKFWDAYVLQAKLEFEVGRRGKALQIAQHLQTQAPESSAGFALEGDMRMLNRQYREASKMYETAYRLDRSDVSATKFQAACVKGGLHKEAHDKIADWLRNSPDNRTLNRLAADTSYKRGDYRAAIERYEWLLRQEPEDVRALNNLALAYHGLKDERAISMAERAYRVGRGKPALGDTFGLILVEQGHTNRGIAVLEEALSAAPKNPDIRFHLAQAHARQGDREKAYKMLDALLQDYPNGEYAAEIMKMVKGSKP